MLLHGFGEDSTIWKKQVDYLKDHYQLIIPDLPGSGQSGMLADGGIDEYSEVIKQMLEFEFLPIPSPEEKKVMVTMIGHSMGGYITLAFAEKYPQWLDSFGLFHSSAFGDNEEKKTTRRKAIDFMRIHGAYEFLKTSIPGLFTKEWAATHPDEINILVEKGRNFSTEAIIQYYEAMIVRPDRIDILKTFPKPILFIIGQHDLAIPFDQSMLQCHMPSISHLHILRNSAHMGMWEETALANSILQSFLKGQPS